MESDSPSYILKHSVQPWPIRHAPRARRLVPASRVSPLSLQLYLVMLHWNPHAHLTWFSGMTVKVTMSGFVDDPM